MTRMVSRHTGYTMLHPAGHTPVGQMDPKTVWWVGDPCESSLGEYPHLLEHFFLLMRKVLDKPSDVEHRR